MSCKNTRRVNKYEVYKVFVDGVLVYVGSGIQGRHKHATSGTSHNYNLNKSHFDSVRGDCVMTTEITMTCETKERSLEIEKSLIKSLTPPYNTTGNPLSHCPRNVEKGKMCMIFIDFIYSKMICEMDDMKIKNIRLRSSIKNGDVRLLIKKLAQVFFSDAGKISIVRSSLTDEELKFCRLIVETREGGTYKLLEKFFTFDKQLQKNKTVIDVYIKEPHKTELINLLLENAYSSKFGWLNEQQKAAN